ncbi:MAG: DNA polymerase III subunit chi [Gammaproteobacteria bacterium]|nr:DNA polymerase III subunit chi [Gammaproteobacteria bacterium]
MSTAVSFYILPSSDESSLLAFAAYLSVKSWRSGQHPHIHCEDEAHAEQFRHAIHQLQSPTLMPLELGTADVVHGATIGWIDEHIPLAGNSIIFNLSNEIVKAFSRFDRLVEITDKVEQRVQAKRALFRFYKDRNYPLQSHTIEWHQLNRVIPPQTV